ncbi:MAG TPA: MarC family protein [Longimicrobiales bacterium]
MTLLSAAILLFFVMDPLGNVPLYVSALRELTPERRRFVVIRELLVALGVLLGFLFAGGAILDALGISQAALTTAGGIVLMLIAVRMIFPSQTMTLREEIIEEPFIFPLAVPYVAGPSVMATELLLISTEPERWPTWVAAVVLAWTATAVILLAAGTLQRFMGSRALTAMERLMGMLLVTVAVEMVMNGVAAFVGR